MLCFSRVHKREGVISSYTYVWRYDLIFFLLSFLYIFLQHSAFSTLRIFYTPHFPHSAFSTLRIFYTPHFLHSAFSTLRIFYTPHFLHSASSTLRTPHSALLVFHLTAETCRGNNKYQDLFILDLKIQ